MALNKVQKKQVIDYYFEEPNAKAVLEDGLDVPRAEVVVFLKEVYTSLLEWIEYTNDRHPSVLIGRSATTADIEAMA